jgi:hypothetical protein
MLGTTSEARVSRSVHESYSHRAGEKKHGVLTCAELSKSWMEKRDSGTDRSSTTLLPKFGLCYNRNTESETSKNS